MIKTDEILRRFAALKEAASEIEDCLTPTLRQNTGKTLRDEFAMAALVKSDDSWNAEQCAKWAYDVADAMIKARGK